MAFADGGEPPGKAQHMKSTRKDVEHIMGEVDDVVLEKILAVGASKAELHEAALAALMEYEMGEEVAPSLNPRVGALSAIIEGLLNLEAEESDFSEEDSDSLARKDWRHDGW
jgi:hypothetical protein